MEGFRYQHKNLGRRSTLHSLANRTVTSCIQQKNIKHKHNSRQKHSFRISNLKTQNQQNIPNIIQLQLKRSPTVGKKNLITQSIQKQIKKYYVNDLNQKDRIYQQIGIKSYLTYQIKNYGNNSQLIDKLMKDRIGWVKVENNIQQQPNFIWGRNNKQYIIDRSQIKNIKKNLKYISSRLQNNKQLTDKGRLYQNIVSYCNKNKIKYDNFLPITFLFNDSINNQRNFKQFLQLFSYVQQNTNLQNIWIYKPTYLNQGRQIVLFNDLQILQKIFNNDNKIKITTSKKIKNQKIINTAQSLQKQQTYYQKLIRQMKQFKKNGKSFVIQKYVQNPLLIQQKKFDMRIWVLIDQNKNYYIYRQGYLRFTSYKYNLTKQNLKNNYIHLTNHALQKYSPNYSDKNLMEMSTLKKWIEQEMGKKDCFQDILSQIKNIIKISILSAFSNENNNKNNKNQRNFKSFQLFGYDFLIDRQLKVRLIQANTNPSITQDSIFMKSLIPRMISDMLSLTIDRYFHCQTTKKYPLEGYSIHQNLWDLLGSIYDNA